MMCGVDQHKVIPLLLRQRPKKGMRAGSSGHGVECRDVATELIDGGRLVVSRAGQPPLRYFDAGLHSTLAQDSFQDQRAQQLANDPVRSVIVATCCRSQTFAYVVDDLREIPVAEPVVAAAQAVDVCQKVLPVPEVQLTPGRRLAWQIRALAGMHVTRPLST